MNYLDVRTVLLINVLTNCLCTVVLLFLWIQNRRRFKGTFFWVIDFWFQTIALVLLALRGSIPDWVSMVVANTLVIAGALLGYMGLERFVEKKSFQAHNYILLFLFPFAYGYFAFMDTNLAARNISVSLVLLIISIQCVWLMFGRIQPGNREMTRGTGIVFGGFCLVSLIRLAIMLSGPQPNNDFFKSGLYDTLLIISYQLLLILLSYSLTLMVNRHLLMDIQTQEEKFTKAFRLSPFAITLTRLSDGRILEINDGFMKITGYGHDEVIEKTAIDLGLWVNKKDRTSVADELARNNRVGETEYQFKKKSGETVIGIFAAETIIINGTPWVLAVIVDITKRKRVEEDRQKLFEELERALSRVKKLSGLLPICAHCKKIRDDKGYWNQIESYIQDRSEAEFSHGICRECAKKYYPDINVYDD